MQRGSSSWHTSHSSLGLGFPAILLLPLVDYCVSLLLLVAPAVQPLAQAAEVHVGAAPAAFTGRDERVVGVLLVLQQADFALLVDIRGLAVHELCLRVEHILHRMDDSLLVPDLDDLILHAPQLEDVSLAESVPLIGVTESRYLLVTLRILQTANDQVVVILAGNRAGLDQELV